jgi:N-acyl-D-aspartate/D-glutamate deacylase
MIANLNVLPPTQKGTLAAAIAAIREADVRGVSASASVTSYSDDEADVRPALTYPRAVMGTGTAAARTEGGLSQISMQPAAYGAFPRLLGEYVRNAKLLELREAIYRVTGLPAAQFRIPQRGFIREDYFADLVIFDPQTIASPATNAQPHQYPTGIDYVIVNGVQVVTPAGHTGAHPGRILPGASPRPAS